MSKYFVTLAFLIFVINQNSAQKVDIGNYRVEYEVASFPNYYTPEEQRTFSVEVRGSRSLQPRIDVNKIMLYGFQQVKNNGNIKLIIDADEIQQGLPEKRIRVDEKKDKDGKVISRTEYYTYRSKSISRSSISFYGPKNAKEQAKAEVKKSKEEAKKADNPFLKGTENKNSTSNEAGQNYSFYGSESLDLEYEYTGSESTNEKTALNSFHGGISGAFSSYLVRLPDDLLNKANEEANQEFGYSPLRLGYQKMKILDTKEHPEYTTFRQATEAAKVLFKNLKYNSDMASFDSDFEPILTYFKDLEAKLKPNDKNQNKLKAAALYNVAMIYCTLDRFDEALAACKKMINAGQDKDDAEDMIDKIYDLKPQMEKHKMTTRHIKF
jgi:hypothetical protein